MVSTPVGMRCRDCAQLRRLPQFEVDAPLLARAAAGGLAVGTISWLLTTYVAYLSFFAAILVGFAVAGAISPLAKRRSSRSLEAVAVVSVAAGLYVAYYLRFAVSGGLPVSALNPGRTVVPIVLASFIAVIRLR